MKIITSTFIIAVAVILTAAALMYGINKQEAVECNEWAMQATQFKGYYITQWQADQCADHHITVNAPVK